MKSAPPIIKNLIIKIDESNVIFNKSPICFISKSSIYPYPSNTSGELISNYHYPRDFIFGKQIWELVPEIHNGYGVENSGVNLLDIGNDGVLDMVGYFQYNCCFCTEPGFFYHQRCLWRKNFYTS